MDDEQRPAELNLSGIAKPLDEQVPRKQEMVHDTSVYRLAFCDYVEPRLVNFYDPEEYDGTTFRWSEPVAMVRLDVPANHYRVTIETASLRGPDCNFRFEMFWNDCLVPKDKMQTSQGKICFDVDLSMFVSTNEQRLTISCKPLNAEQGRRKLGMPIASIELEPRNGDSHETALKHVDQLVAKHSKRSIIPRRRARKTPKPILPIWKIQMPAIAERFPIAQTNDALTSKSNDCDSVVATAVEINSRHGTGLLVQYLFNEFSNLATVTSMRCYDGDRVRSAVHHDLPNGEHNRQDIYRFVMEWFEKNPPKRAYVVPFFENDMIIAMALKDLFGTKVALHIMDDNCLFGSDISKKIATEACEKSDLRLAISTEMKIAYEQCFGMKFWVLPPIVPPSLILEEPTQPPEIQSITSTKGSSRWLRKLEGIWRRKPAVGKTSVFKKRGILIGNIWDSSWLKLLRTTVRESGLQLDWYSNNPQAVWLKDSIGDLESDGIHLHNALWGEELVEELRQRPFAVMPSGRLGKGNTRESIARLSLPSRIPFVVATSQLPVVVLGSRETAAARFVERFDLGRVADYDGPEFARAVDEICNPDTQKSIRNHAREIATVFSANGVSEWLWESLEKGLPHDHRFEKLFSPRNGEFSFFIDAPAPKQIHWNMRELWQMLRRLADRGFNPQRIIDVGASNGVWSWTAATIFPNAKYVLVDPLLTRYPEDQRNYYLRPLKEHEVIEAALSNHAGNTEILVSDDLYGSSLLSVNDAIREASSAKVDVLTLDQLALQRSWTGSTLLKLDVQFAEHMVIEGGLEFIQSNVDALILELTIEREHPQAKTYREMLDMMDQLGYRLFDEMEGWRNPLDGRLEQKDSLFVRKQQPSVLARAA